MRCDQDLYASNIGDMLLQANPQNFSATTEGGYFCPACKWVLATQQNLEKLGQNPRYSKYYLKFGWV